MDAFLWYQSVSKLNHFLVFRLWGDSSPNDWYSIDWECNITGMHITHVRGCIVCLLLLIVIDLGLHIWVSGWFYVGKGSCKPWDKIAHSHKFVCFTWTAGDNPSYPYFTWISFLYCLYLIVEIKRFTMASCVVHLIMLQMRVARGPGLRCYLTHILYFVNNAHFFQSA